MNEIPLQSSIERSRDRFSSRWIFAVVFGLMVMCVGVGSVAYHMGASQPRLNSLQDAVLHATATHGGENVAIATGQIGEECEGLFILDFLTGNLQCWVYNNRFYRHAAKFETNILREFPAAGKGSEYLMVTSAITQQQATSNNSRPANCLCYVIDPRSGLFAGYTFGWNKQAEVQGIAQGGPMVCIGGDIFRTPTGGGTAKKPEATMPEATKEKSKKAAK